MVKVDLETHTLAILVAGIYSGVHEVEPIAIPESVWLGVAEKLEYFLPDWNYDKISFEDWINNCLTILPKVMLSEEELEYLQGNSLYWEVPNGNAILIVSMDVTGVNAK